MLQHERPVPIGKVRHGAAAAAAAAACNRVEGVVRVSIAGCVVLDIVGAQAPAGLPHKLLRNRALAACRCRKAMGLNSRQQHHGGFGATGQH